ncbi:MAG: glycoside hydrolase family 31 protein [bacterium]|nr:glycoside hydrolase family 31 protein [bacterium]
MALKKKYFLFVLILVFSAFSCGGGNQTTVELGTVRVEVTKKPPKLRFLDSQDRLIAETQPGIIELAQVEEQYKWFQGNLGVARTTKSMIDLSEGSLKIKEEGDVLELTLSDNSGHQVATLKLQNGPRYNTISSIMPYGPGSQDTLKMEFSTLAAENPSTDEINEVHFLFVCQPGEGFYGLGGQSDKSEHRGETVPIRSTEQGILKDAGLREDDISLVGRGHIHDAYFPLPYVVVHKTDAEPRTHGWLLDTISRSRFLLCSEDPDRLEIQARLARFLGESLLTLYPAADLYLLPGPDPKSVVGQYTAIEGLPLPLPRWAFGPWVAIKGEPLDVAAQLESLRTFDIPATAIWDQDFQEYDHPDLSVLVDRAHALGFRLLTYFNTFLHTDVPAHLDAINSGYSVKTEAGDPYMFLQVSQESSLVDFSNSKGMAWMFDHLKEAWNLGIDGWMADYGEWVAPDMVFKGVETNFHTSGMENYYSFFWAGINDAVLRDAHPNDSGNYLFFSRSGYLGSNRYLRVTWPGDQVTSFDQYDGLPSVIPYGTSLGLSGVSAFGPDIAGYTPIAAPPSTKELYFRWTELGAFMPVMRTHRGFDYERNWNWNKDLDTIALFRRYALLHLRMAPYLEALHQEATETGIPAIRHLMLEFPAWTGVAESHYEWMLGPSLVVAPVIEAGALTRTLRLPPGTWYDLFTGKRYEGDSEFTVDAPLDSIPVFLRAGGIVPLLDERVRGAEPGPDAPERIAASDIEDERLEIWIGSFSASEAIPPEAVSGSGQFTLLDGTSITLEEDSTLPANSGINEEGTVLAVCPTGTDPWDSDCFQETDSGQILVAARTGPGEITFGGGSTNGIGVRITLSGGPSGRRYKIRIFRGI